MRVLPKRSPEKKGAAQLKREQYTLKTEALARQRAITSETGIRILEEIRVASSRISRNEDHAREVQVPFWLPNSMFRIQFYNKMDNPNDAIDADAKFLIEFIKQLRAKYPSWNLEIRNSNGFPAKVIIKAK